MKKLIFSCASCAMLLTTTAFAADTGAASGTMTGSMADMVAFSGAFLSLICDFLMTPPVFYLFCLICFCFVCKLVRTLL